MITKLFIPNHSVTDSVVIGLPGFMHRDEEGRIDWLLEELSREYHMTGIKANFPGIERQGNQVVCNFNLKDYVEAVEEAVLEARRQVNISLSEKIGIVTSSISSGVLGHYLAIANPENPFNCIVSISPLPGWNQFLTPQIRDTIIKRGEGLDLTTEEDKSRGMKRILPSTSMEEAQRTDSLDALQYYSPKRKASALTLIGTQDKVVSPEFMIQYHRAIKGEESGIEMYQTRHNIPHKLSKDRIIDFLVESLS